MAAIWLVWRAVLRRRAPAWLAVAVAAAALPGVGMALVAGARRADTTLVRLSEATRAADVYVGTGLVLPGHLRLDDVARLPQVIRAARLAAPFFIGGVTDAGRPIDLGAIEPFVPEDSRYGTLVDRPKLVAGRAVQPARPNDVVVGNTVAKRYGVAVGDTLRLRFATPDNVRRLLADPSPANLRDPRAAVSLRFRVVGVAADAHTPDYQPRVYFSGALLRAYANRVGLTFSLLALRLHHGLTDVPALRSAIQRMTRGRSVLFYSRADRTGDLDHSIRVQAQATGLTGVVGFLAGLLLVAQLVSRQVELDPAQTPVLRALGLDAARTVSVALIPAALIAAAAAAAAALVAIVLSALMPLGDAHVLEPNPGPAVDALIVGGGTTVVAVVALAVGAMRAARTAAAPRSLLGQAPAGSAERSPVTSFGFRPGTPVTAAVGCRMALRGHRQQGIGMRSTAAALAIAATAVGGILTFGAGMARLTSTPRLYGQTYDAWGAIEPRPARALARLVADQSISAVSAIALTNVVAASRTVSLAAITPRKGSIPVSIAAGRSPETDRDVALGARTLAQLHARIGAHVVMDLGRVRRPFRITGQAVLPNIGGPTGNLTPSAGALVTPGGLRRLGATEAPSRAMVRFLPTVDRHTAVVRLGENFGPAQPPADIVNFGRVERAPLVMAALFTAAGVMALAHGLAVSQRRHRRDLAVLKTVGFTPRQIAAVICWQALTITSFALAVGLPLGVAVGRLTWNLFAERAGFVPQAVTPTASVVAIVAAALACALLVALAASAAPARTWPAGMLRHE